MEQYLRLLDSLIIRLHRQTDHCDGSVCEGDVMWADMEERETVNAEQEEASEPNQSQCNQLWYWKTMVILNYFLNEYTEHLRSICIAIH